MHRTRADTDVAARFLASAFHDDDLIVIAFRRLAPLPPGPIDDSRHQRLRRPLWHHRFVTAATARDPRYLGWLAHLNAEGHDIYVGMNTFLSRTGGRTEQNVKDIRHIYADVDSGGDVALSALRSRPDLPAISYLVRSSAGKFQVIWNVVESIDSTRNALCVTSRMRSVQTSPYTT